MKLQFNSPYAKNTYLVAFINGRLEDSKGKIYKGKGEGATGCDLTVTNGGNFIKKLEFVPSIYFDMDKIDKLYFCFDGIKLNTSIGPNDT